MKVRPEARAWAQAEPEYPDEWHSLFGNTRIMGIDNVAAFCEDDNAGKYGPTFVSYKILEPGMPNFHALIASLVAVYSDQLTAEFWPQRAA